MPVTRKPTIKDLMEEVKEMKEKVEEIDSLRKRIVDLETKLASLTNPKAVEICSEVKSKKCKKCTKTLVSKADIKEHDKVDHKSFSVTCDLCDIAFSRNSDLEFHLETDHKKEKCFKCEMSFVLKWRLHWYT